MECIKKKFTKRGAAQALKRISVQRIWGDPDRREQNSYYCQGCNCWHLTSQEPRNQNWGLSDGLRVSS